MEVVPDLDWKGNLQFDPTWNWFPRSILVHTIPLSLLAMTLGRGLATGRDFWVPFCWGLVVPWLNTRGWAGRPWAFRDALNRDGYPPTIAVLHASVWSLAAAWSPAWAPVSFLVFFLAYDGLLLRFRILSIYALGVSLQERGALVLLAAFGFLWWGYLSLGLSLVHAWGRDDWLAMATASVVLMAPAQLALIGLQRRRPPVRFSNLRRVAVVGAGWSGIYTVKWLRQAGLEVAWFEAAEDVGGVWKFRREPGGVGVNTRATSSKHFLHASDFPMPNSYPDFPEHVQILNYLRSYVDHFGLWPSLRRGVEVERVRKAGPGWAVEARGRDGRLFEESFDAVAICAGPHQAPRVNPASDPIYSRFQGPVLHAGDFKDGGDVRPGESVLVVGSGESAADIVGECAAADARVHWSSRHGQWFADRNIGPFAADHFTAVGARVLLGRFLNLEHLIRRFVIAPFIHLAWGRGGHGVAGWSPDAPYLHQFVNKSRDAIREIHRGRVKARGAVLGIEGRRVDFAGGDSSVVVDRIVLATGYQPDWGFLELPTGGLFKKVFSVTDPSLAFVGYVRPALGSIPSLAELQARWVSAVWSGRVGVPHLWRRRSIAYLDRELESRAMFDSSRLGVLVDQEAYASMVAAQFGAQVRWLRLIFDPRGLWILLRSPWTAFKYQLHEGRERREQAWRHMSREMPPWRWPGYGGHPVFLLTGSLLALAVILLIALAAMVWFLPNWMVAAGLAVMTALAASLLSVTDGGRPEGVAREPARSGGLELRTEGEVAFSRGAPGDPAASTRTRLD